MSQFLERYFNIIALMLTLLTGVIFVTFMLLKSRVEKHEDKKLHLVGLIIISLYEVLLILLLVFVSTNVILRLYSILLGVSLGMLFYVEILYMYKYFKNNKKENIEPIEA